MVNLSTGTTNNCAALLLAVLGAEGQDGVYVPGRMINTVTTTFGEARTNAQDSLVIAQTARMRLDLATVTTSLKVGVRAGPPELSPEGPGHGLGGHWQLAA